jgi:hypothetical protein
MVTIKNSKSKLQPACQNKPIKLEHGNPRKYSDFLKELEEKERRKTSSTFFPLKRKGTFTPLICIF